jgi:hypothetical protein
MAHHALHSHATSRRRGRPTGMTPDRIRKRHIIAAAVIQDIAITAVARQIGVSRSWASREANSAEVRDLIAHLIAANQETVATLLGQALGVVKGALTAETTLCRDGVWITVPDHRVRMEAVRVFCCLLRCFESLRGQ